MYTNRTINQSRTFACELLASEGLTFTREGGYFKHDSHMSFQL